jgi:hypothetical protein
MSRAMRASGEGNPKAMLVSSRILVWTDSIRALGKLVVESGVELVADRGDAFGGVDEGRDAAAPGPGQPSVQRLFARSVG